MNGLNSIWEEMGFGNMRYKDKRAETQDSLEDGD